MEGTLSKREYFAGLAMQGMLASSMPADSGIEPYWLMVPDKLTSLAVSHADSLLKQLDQ